MRHPDITTWADYARGVATDDERAALRGHLHEGCGVCAATVAAFETVAETASADAALTPPAGALRSVKAFFATQHPRAHGFWSELELRTVFDSSLTPAAASSRRSHGADDRHLLYQSEQYTVELSLDFPADTVEAVLRGQILAAHGEPRSHTPVFLVGDGTVLGQTISARQGTFEISGRLDQPCELWVFPDDENRIRLNLSSEG